MDGRTVPVPPAVVPYMVTYLLAYASEPLPCGDEGIEEPAPSPVPLVYRRPRPARVVVRDVPAPSPGRATLGIVPSPQAAKGRAIADRLARAWGHR